MCGTGWSISRRRHIILYTPASQGHTSKIPYSPTAPKSSGRVVMSSNYTQVVHQVLKLTRQGKPSAG